MGLQKWHFPQLTGLRRRESLKVANIALRFFFGYLPAASALAGVAQRLHMRRLNTAIELTRYFYNIKINKLVFFFLGLSSLNPV